MTTISKILDSLPSQESDWNDAEFIQRLEQYWLITINLESLKYHYLDEEDYQHCKTASPDIDDLSHFAIFGVRRPLSQNPWDTAKLCDEEEEKWNGCFLPLVYFTNSLEDARNEICKLPMEFAVAYNYRTGVKVILTDNHNLDGQLFTQVSWNHLQTEITKRKLAIFYGEFRNQQYDCEIGWEDDVA